ncbi:MAG: hypothetical protein F6J98_09470 [Moorea sp. SIO4G2]|nr:hypothetical protein [Moorena sp. SIO4G2]
MIFEKCAINFVYLLISVFNNYKVQRYTVIFTYSLFPIPSYLFPVPCSLFPT